MTRPPVTWAPPARDGVGASRVAVSGGPWATLCAFLDARLPPGQPWAERLARGDVLNAEGQPLRADAPCPPHNSVLWYWRSLPPEPRVPFEIEVLHHDEHLVAIDKPHFLPVTPGGRYLQETALVRLKRLLAIETLVPMHRLDLETAGVLLFMVQPATRHAYQAMFRERRVHKVYEAVAPWREDLTLPVTVSSRLQERPGEAFMQMETVDGEPNAITHIELIGRLGPLAPWAHYRLRPMTGAKHQLRAHMSAAGLPIVGDRIYPRLWPAAPAEAVPDYSQPLQLLARELRFTDPVTGEPRCFTSRRRLQNLDPGLQRQANTG
jgi:tRNA pseudouridine32 synthase / 23S rRNA pseudouridine746 synthase